jgi:hypothetical protein
LESGLKIIYSACRLSDYCKLKHQISANLLNRKKDCKFLFGWRSSIVWLQKAEIINYVLPLSNFSKIKIKTPELFLFFGV